MPYRPKSLTAPVYSTSIDLVGVRHVASSKGVEHFHEPIGSPIVSHPHLPKYAQKHMKVHGAGGAHVGYVANLPGPMKISTGKKVAAFDINGTKVGHYNSHDEAHAAVKAKAAPIFKAAAPVQKVQVQPIHAKSSGPPKTETALAGLEKMHSGETFSNGEKVPGTGMRVLATNAAGQVTELEVVPS